MTRFLPRPAVVRAAALSVALLAAAGCSANALTGPHPSTSTTSTAATTHQPPPAPTAAPKTGVCRNLDYSSISHYSNADQAVACSGPHTSYTFAVETIPADVSVAGVSIGNKSIQDAASLGCRTAFNRFIGGDPAERAQSRLSVTYFLPTQQDFNRGAHWVRCDVVALKTANSLAPLPPDPQGLLDDPKSLASYGVCSQGVPGGTASALVMCTEQHTYRALTTLRLGADAAPYPGEAVTGKGGQARCSAYIATALGTTKGYTLWWTFPTTTDWAAGQRFGYCWEATHH